MHYEDSFVCTLSAMPVKNVAFSLIAVTKAVSGKVYSVLKYTFITYLSE